jgi:hypothetical protein
MQNPFVVSEFVLSSNVYAAAEPLPELTQQAALVGLAVNHKHTQLQQHS